MGRKWAQVVATVVAAVALACGGDDAEEGFGSASCTDPAEDVAVQEGITGPDGEPVEPGTLVPDGAMDLRRATVVTEAHGALTATMQFGAPIEEALATTVEAGGEARTWRAWLRLDGDITIAVELSGGGAEADPLSLHPTLSGTLTARRPVSEDQDLYVEVPATVGDGQAVSAPGTPVGIVSGPGELELEAEVDGDTLTVTAAALDRYVLAYPPARLSSAGATSFDDHKIDTCEGPFDFA